MKKKGLVLALILLSINMMCNFMTADAAKAEKKLKTPTITLSNVASTGKIKISWGKIDGAKTYKLYNSLDGDSWKLIKTTTNTSVTNTSTVAGKKYYYRVKAIAAKSAQNSAYSKVKSRVCDLARPEITLKTLESTGKIKISWKKIDKAKAYKLYRSTDNKSWKLIKTTENTSVTNTSAVAGKRYYYKVRAIASKEDANSAYSVVKNIKCGYPDERTKQYVDKLQVTLYESANSSSKSISIPYMTEVELGQAVSSGSSGTWYKAYLNNKLYYVWIVKGDGKFTTKKSTFQYETDTKYQQQVVDLAVDIAQNWKTEYQHKQSNGIPNQDGVYGFDCSGFASYVINTVMQKDVPTYRLTSVIAKLYETKSIYNEGFPEEFSAVKVKKDNLQPGDVLFFSLKSDIDHCGIYLGNGEFAHASNYWKDDSVCIMPLKDNYLDKLTAVRRYLPKSVSPANKTVKVIKNGCKLYKEKSSESAIVHAFKAGEKVTVLYTDNGNWAYVKYGENTKAYVLLKNLDI